MTVVGDRLAVGAPFANSGRGAVSVFDADTATPIFTVASPDICDCGTCDHGLRDRGPGNPRLDSSRPAYPAFRRQASSRFVNGLGFAGRKIRFRSISDSQSEPNDRAKHFGPRNSARAR